MLFKSLMVFNLVALIKLPNKAVQESSTSMVQQAAGDVHSGEEVSLTL